MATNYPTALDTLTNPTANDSLNSPSVPHATQHANANDAIEALQAAVGVTNSADQASIQYKLAGTISVANAASATASTALATAQSAMPNTTTAAGTLISGATAKSTPVNADVLAISDSAASNVLKKLSWSDLKTTILTALDSVFAKLAGLAGGQTLIGGTQPSENLTLQSTAHATRGKLLLGASSAYDEVNVRIGVGTQSPSAKVHVIGTTEQLRLGYDASNYYALTVTSTGMVTHDATGGQHSFKSTNSTPTLGSELVTNGGFASDLSGWTDSGSSWSWSSGTALHTAGSVSTLSQTLSGIASGSAYEIDFTISGRTAGSITVQLGSVYVYDFGTTSSITSSKKRSVVAAATGSVALTITPSSDFDGKVDDVSVKLISLVSAAPTVVLLDSAGASALSFRTGLSAGNNISVGLSCGGSIVNGTDNVSIGSSAARGLVNGTQNVLIGGGCGRGSAAHDASMSVAIGYQAYYSVTSGWGNVCVGHSAGYSLTSSVSNTAVGYESAYSVVSNANASSITAIGRGSLRQLSQGASTSAFGANAARFIADGSTALTNAASSLYVGALTKASADGVTNENVFGYNATGIGSNSCVIGSSAVTKCQIYGDLIFDKTITAGGTTGAQTINKTCGSVNFAAAATSLVVTNNRVTTSSVIVATVATNDSTMKTVTAVAGSGSFTLYANAAATAETRVNWIVIN